MITKPKRCAILDRDGTIIYDKHYLSDPVHVELLPGAAAGLRKMSALGLGLVIVTNQSGIGRGYFTTQQLDQVHARLKELLRLEEVVFDGIFVCPHTPEDRCECRKPRPGLLHAAAKALHFSIPDSFVIGDKACDLDLGKNAGATSLLVRTGYGDELLKKCAILPNHVATNLEMAADLIAALMRSP
jgi:D-glycero-D-manno-heptose 1,7-bisphosphate phosphatase